MKRLVIKYTAFALLAMGINIGTQYISLLIYSGEWGLYTAIFFGTGTGLVIKYILDKMFIFYHKTEDLKDDFFKFVLYTAMGIITTFIFWGSELLFDYFLQYKEAKYIGAVIGLTAGYIIKYHLDKKFVFTARQQQS